MIVAFALLLLALPLATAAETTSPTPPAGFTGAFASEQEVAERIVRALQDYDRDSLIELLVTREEYRDLIIPGSVPPGQPWRDWPEKVRAYQTDEFLTKNYYVADALLERFGGRKLTIKEVRFTEGTRRYASYNARGELRIHVDMHPAGPENPVIRAGWIAEVDGRYKLLGFRARGD